MRAHPNFLLRAKVTATEHRWLAPLQPGGTPERDAGDAGTTVHLKTGHLTGLAA